MWVCHTAIGTELTGDQDYSDSFGSPGMSFCHSLVVALIRQESYSPDDNRFDMRPFLYPSRFEHQFAKIDALAEQLPNRATQPGADKAKLD